MMTKRVPTVWWRIPRVVVMAQTDTHSGKFPLSMELIHDGVDQFSINFELLVEKETKTVLQWDFQVPHHCWDPSHLYRIMMAVCRVKQLDEQFLEVANMAMHYEFSIDEIPEWFVQLIGAEEILRLRSAAPPSAIITRLAWAIKHRQCRPSTMTYLLEKTNLSWNKAWSKIGILSPKEAHALLVKRAKLVAQYQDRLDQYLTQVSGLPFADSDHEQALYGALTLVAEKGKYIPEKLFIPMVIAVAHFQVLLDDLDEDTAIELAASRTAGWMSQFLRMFLWWKFDYREAFQAISHLLEYWDVIPRETILIYPPYSSVSFP
ncbi:hypothetical protein KC571_01215 [candidate division WWE3 bacterium]|uniref:Uncharacterized protein n=1 Tax=candidate division WWE3 bacterium TaxID=2053526 RepID=A0A955RQ11_UNCKA|nr:hypothetical protein [candidate division WWE3 bacterium]